MPKKKRLRRLSIFETAIADSTASNGEAKIVFFKTKAPPKAGDSVKNVEGGNMPLNLDDLELSEDIKKTLRTEFDRLQMELDTSKAETEELKKTKDPMNTPVETVESTENAVEIPENVPEEFRKSIDKAFTLQTQEISKLRQQLDDRDRAEAIAFAKTRYASFDNSEELGTQLYELGKVNPELRTNLEKTLDAAESIAKTTKSIETEIGSTSLNEANGAYGKLEAITKTKLEAGAYKTHAEAFTAALTENPGLYDEYEAEQRGR